MCEHTLRVACLAYITCLVLVVCVSGYSDDIAISSWTLSRYRDPGKVHDSGPNLTLYHYHSTVGVCGLLSHSMIDEVIAHTHY